MKHYGIRLHGRRPHLRSKEKKKIEAFQRYLYRKFSGITAIERSALVNILAKGTYSDDFTVGECKVLLKNIDITVIDDLWDSTYKLAVRREYF